MSYYSSSSSTLYSSSAADLWDPEVVLGLTNRATFGPSCIGHAKTYSRRCQRYIAQHKTAHGRGIINRLARGTASEAAESPDLSRAVDILLCWQHTGQSSSIHRQWKTKLEDWAAENEVDDQSSATLSDWGSRRGSSSDSDSDSDPDTDPDIDGRSPDEESHTERGSTGELPSEDLRRMMKILQARLEAQLRRERERQEEEKRKAEEEKRKAKEEEERRRREERRREEERRKEEERKKREEKAREEAFRERVRLAKEKQQREAKEKAEKEAASWRVSWKRYHHAWHTTSTELSEVDIPWPVKSGLRSDVNEANIKLFFMKAPPEELRNSGEKIFKFINKETKRWHTDKVMQRFGEDVANGKAKSALDTIAKVLIELRKDAKLKR